MAPDHSQRLQQALATLQQRVVADARMPAEVRRARREFFGPSGEPPAASTAQLAELRFREWFLLERESELLGAVPATAVLLADDEQLLPGSIAGVFTVELVEGGQAELLDLQDQQRLDVEAGGHGLQAGDFVVGRLYPQRDGALLPSPALVVYRPGAVLAAAFRADLQRVTLERRLFQHELEHLLLQQRQPSSSPGATLDVVPLERLEAELEQLLQAGGADLGAADVSLELAAVERPGAVIEPLLEQLAFDTAVDIDAVRRCLLAIWNAHALRRWPATPDAAEVAPPDAPAGEVPGETLGERLARTLDEGLARKRDVAELFAQLERMAGIEGGDEEEDEESEDDDAAGSAPAEPGAPAPGDLGPLVQEFLWETGQGDTPLARTLSLWVQLQGNSALPHSNLEAVTGTDLLRVLLHVYLGALPQQRAEAVRAAFSHFGAFYQWAETSQHDAIGQALRDCRGALLDDLQRLQDAGTALTAKAAESARPPALLHVEDVGPAGFGVRMDDSLSFWVAAPQSITALLRAGDLLLAALVPGPNGQARLSGLVVALPADASTLIE